jgi:hypothetical protein
MLLIARFRFAAAAWSAVTLFLGATWTNPPASRIAYRILAQYAIWIRFEQAKLKVYNLR